MNTPGFQITLANKRTWLAYVSVNSSGIFKGPTSAKGTIVFRLPACVTADEV
jgi:hypothetical protein